MRRFCLAALAPLLCLAARAEGPVVHAWQASLTLPTYQEGDPDPAPQFSALVSRNSNYPYPLRTNLAKLRTEVAWRTLNLENEYLLCRVLPDLGGHLYSCLDKRNGREAFYANPVIRKAPIGLRGAWAAVGVESNFPAGHARDSASPVDFALRTDPDGSARAVVEDIDRVSGMQWRVEYVLRPASALLQQRVTLYNRGSARRPYDWWANAEVELDDPATRFILPARLVASHGSTVIESWPVTSQGVDESRVSSHQNQAAWFAYCSREPFFAVYKPASKTGLAHFADPRAVAGKKLFLWGERDDRMVETELTDRFPSYVEIQGGLFQNQETFQFLEPGASRTFSEFWIPIYNLGGISRVTAGAAIYLDRRKGLLKRPLALEVCVTHPAPGAEIRMFSAGQPGFEVRADLDPAATFTHVLEGAGPGPYTVQIADSRGAILLEHTEDRYDAQGPEGIALGKQTPPAPASAETEAAVLEAGSRDELDESPSSALQEYRKGLDRYPGSLPLHKALGRLDVGLNRFEEAVAMLARVHAATPSDDEASYYLGVAQAMLGRDAEAGATLSAVRSPSPYAPPAALQLAFLAARAKRYQAALDALKPLLTARAGALEVALLRRLDHRKEAADELAAWQAVDPAGLMLRFERTLLGEDDPDLWLHFAADSERLLTVADEYLSLGFDDDALALLARPFPPAPPETVEPGAVPPGRSPLVSYYRAYCRTRLGQDPAGDLKAAATASPRYAFPFRPSSFAVLKSAIQANPTDVQARLLLGRLFMHALMTDEAISAWQRARSLHRGLPELDRDLGTVAAEVNQDPLTGYFVLRDGLKAAPDDPGLLAAMKRLGHASLPETSSSNPVEVAAAAMLKAASGFPEQAAPLFNRGVFPAAKQPDIVRRAYLEVRLQRLAAQAAAGACSSLPDRIYKLEAEDVTLPFTFYGFASFVKAPHFQYSLAAIEESCGQEKDARKLWLKISRTEEPLSSPEFIFPPLAAWKIDPAEARPRIAAALASVRGALAGAQPGDRPLLVYAEGALLHAQGDDEQAALRLMEALRTSRDPDVRYLALLQYAAIFK